MINIGQYNTLEILRSTAPGIFLGELDGEEEVLLPNKYCPEAYDLGDKLDVFVYLDHEERPVATNIEPKIKLFEFAHLKVVDVNKYGAFMDWGLEKELFVPFKEQRQPMEVGRWYIVYLDIDNETDRLFASNKISAYLDNEDPLEVKVDEEVDVLVYEKTDLGYNVIIKDLHKGLIYNNEIFKDIRIGETTKAFIKKIREENKIDVALQAQGYYNANDSNEDLILAKLKETGSMNIGDKSDPEVIKETFGLSKKAFKKALGGLYKKKMVKLGPEKTELI